MLKVILRTVSAITVLFFNKKGLDSLVDLILGMGVAKSPFHDQLLPLLQPYQVHLCIPSSL